ncbi:MAG TPA: STAS domain-containing protein [Candidatus Cybelea sp.]|nr:STAS domain-containing protein [Candidatus Cybelea sp.]
MSGEMVDVVRLSGELEIARKGEIRDALAAASTGTAVLLDLGEVTYADSIALTELLRFCAEATRNDRPVALVIRTPQFARLVQYAGLAGAFKIFSDAAEAMEYLRERAGGS